MTCIHQYAESPVPIDVITYVLALGNGRQVNLDLGHGQNIRRGGHVHQEVYIHTGISRPL